MNFASPTAIFPEQFFWLACLLCSVTIQAYFHRVMKNVFCWRKVLLNGIFKGNIPRTVGLWAQSLDPDNVLRFFSLKVLGSDERHMRNSAWGSLVGYLYLNCLSPLNRF
jgi:hypothetical protein